MGTVGTKLKTWVFGTYGDNTVMKSNFELSIQIFFFIQVFKILPLIDDTFTVKTQ